MKTSIAVLVGLFALGSAQLFNSFNHQKTFTNTYKPITYTPYVAYNTRNNVRSNEGQYVHTNDGQYYHDNSGAYVHQDDKYKHQEDKYKHLEDKYRHQEPKYKYSHNVAESRTQKQTAATENLYGINPGLQRGNAAGLYDNKNYRIIRKIENVGSEKYNYLYETENGIYAEEQGKLFRVGNDMESIIAQGYFTYTGPDSIVYTVKYTADENGFVAEGAHLPTPPPVPEHIVRALEYQRSHGKL